jgi:hypothetical protein
MYLKKTILKSTIYQNSKHPLKMTWHCNATKIEGKEKGLACTRYQGFVL